MRRPALAHDGHDLAAALMTIDQIGDRPALHEAVGQAFPGAQLLQAGAGAAVHRLEKHDGQSRFA